jgi:SAM-dependent methyltransferase
MAIRPDSRNLQNELMDDPSLEASVHRQALRGLHRINYWSRTDAALWEAFKNLTFAAAGRELSVLDIASGGGDLAIRLAKIARREGCAIQIDGCYLSPTAVAFASEQVQAAGLTNVRFHVCHALEQPFPSPRYDVVMCSLFLHHLSDENAVKLLRRMREAAVKLVLVDDLRRTAIGYWLAWLGCRILTRCHVCHVDGPMSVEAAFTIREAQDMAERAGLAGATISSHWPQRFLLSWRPNQGDAFESD